MVWACSSDAQIVDEDDVGTIVYLFLYVARLIMLTVCVCSPNHVGTFSSIHVISTYLEPAVEQTILWPSGKVLDLSSGSDMFIVLS